MIVRDANLGTRSVLCALAIIGLIAGPAVVQGQDTTPAKPSPATAAATVIRVTGDGAHPLTLSAADLADMPRRVVYAPAEHGQPAASYVGVLLRDVLARAGVPLGANLHGSAMATYVVCAAADGYRIVFSLAELDSAFSNRTIVLADHRDGQLLPAHDGPFRLVIPGDSRPARWIRQLTTITVTKAGP